MNKTTFLFLMVFLLGIAGAIFALTGNDPVDITPNELEAWLDDPEADQPNDPTPLEASDAKPEEADAAVPEGLEEISREEITAAAGSARNLVLQVWDGKKGVPSTGATRPKPAGSGSRPMGRVGSACPRSCAGRW